MNWVIRQSRPEDLEGIRLLHEAVYPGAQDDTAQWCAEWSWKYERNPAGIGDGVVAIDGDQVVGHAGMFPQELGIDGCRVLACQSVDTMVHPFYRRQGMSVALGRARIAKATAHGYGTMLAFPAPAKHEGDKARLGWHDIALRPLYIRALGLRPAWRTVAHIGGASLSEPGNVADSRRSGALVPRDRPSYYQEGAVREVDAFDERANHLWTSTQRRHRVAVARTSSYLNWRYHRPGLNYRILIVEQGNELRGYAVCRTSMVRWFPVCIVYDVAGVDTRDMRAALNGVVEAARAECADMVCSSVVGGSIDRNAFFQCGFFRIPRRYLGWFNAYLLPNAEYSDLISDASNWLVTLGDSDAK